MRRPDRKVSREDPVGIGVDKAQCAATVRKRRAIVKHLQELRHCPVPPPQESAHVRFLPDEFRCRACPKDEIEVIGKCQQLHHILAGKRAVRFGHHNEFRATPGGFSQTTLEGIPVALLCLQDVGRARALDQFGRAVPTVVVHCEHVVNNRSPTGCEEVIDCLGNVLLFIVGRKHDGNTLAVPHQSSPLLPWQDTQPTRLSNITRPPAHG